MRRSLILVLLLVGMTLIEPLGQDTPASGALLTFGFLILAAYTVGEVAATLRMPKLVGYLVAGMLFGPSALGTVSYEDMLRLDPVNQLAVALIALMAGAELEWKQVRSDGVRYLKVLSVEMALTFALSIAATIALARYIPVLHGRPFVATLVFALLYSSIAIAHSPAATLALIKETRAEGPVARTTLGVVLVSDVVLVVMFTLIATVSRLLLPPGGNAHLPSLGSVIWEISGAILVGGVIGGGTALYLRFAPRELLLFGIIVAMLGAEVARLAHVELLLTLLAAGFVAQNLAPGDRGTLLRHAVERAAAPVFVVFFALSGAAIRIAEVAALIGIVAPLVLSRALGISVGTLLAGRWAGIPREQSRLIWPGLIAQAGVAIGLSSVVAEVYPDLGHSIRNMALAVIAINQLAGPIMFRRALDAAGENPARPARRERDPVQLQPENAAPQ